MKRIIAAMAALILSIGCYAQDMIVKKDGTIIQAKVSEIGTSEVKYKKWSNQDGPSYAIAKSDILAITYQNGEKESFNSHKNQTTSSNYNNNINQSLISKYNKELTITKNIVAKNKSAKGMIAVFGMARTSMLTTDKIEVSFECTYEPTYYDTKQNHYYIKFKNKTDNVIYIDKGNCFRQPSDGTAYCYYNNEQLSVTNSQSHGISIGAGGISGGFVGGGHIGGSSGISATNTYSKQRILAIPPHGEINLEEYKYVKTTKKNVVKDAEYEVVESPEIFDIFWVKRYAYGFSYGSLKYGEIINYDEGNTPFYFNYHFTYSTDQNFNSTESLNARIYIRSAIGVDDLCDLSEPKRYFSNLDKYSIIGKCGKLPKIKG